VNIFQQEVTTNLDESKTKELVRAVLRGEHCSNAVINVIFVQDKTIRELNNKYLQHHYTTDVLSFTLSEENTQPLEGEVYVNVARAKRQAREYGVSTLNEIGRLVVHGVLHLLGYEDDTLVKKHRMSTCEDHYLGNVGLDYFHA
jgi:rRNA maturation RNase YbeY